MIWDDLDLTPWEALALAAAAVGTLAVLWVLLTFAWLVWGE